MQTANFVHSRVIYMYLTALVLTDTAAYPLGQMYPPLAMLLHWLWWIKIYQHVLWTRLIWLVISLKWFYRHSLTGGAFVGWRTRTYISFWDLDDSEAASWHGDWAVVVAPGREELSRRMSYHPWFLEPRPGRRGIEHCSLGVCGADR
jgi:hypothetical protein